MFSCIHTHNFYVTMKRLKKCVSWAKIDIPTSTYIVLQNVTHMMILAIFWDTIAVRGWGWGVLANNVQSGR